MEYLLRVRDDLRQGALRFRYHDSAALLAPEVMGVPPLVELGKLLGPAERLDRDAETAAELACCCAEALPWMEPDRRRRSQLGWAHLDRKVPEPEQRRMGRDVMGGGGVAACGNGRN
jgi:hypothetical protein